ITDNAATSPQNVSLSGSGVTGSAGVTINPGSLNLGAAVLGTTSGSQAITVTSTGNIPLSISSIVLSGTNAGEFAQTSNCPTGSNTLAVNASCTINVTFTPAATGARSASVTITDNAPTNPQS